MQLLLECILTVPNTHPTVRLCCDLEVEEDSEGDTETEPYEHGAGCEDTECIHSHHQPIVGEPAVCIHDRDRQSCPHLNSEGALAADVSTSCPDVGFKNLLRTD